MRRRTNERQPAAVAADRQSVWSALSAAGHNAACQQEVHVFAAAAEKNMKTDPDFNRRNKFELRDVERVEL